MRGSRIALIFAVVAFAVGVALWGLGKTIDPVSAAVTKSEDAGGAKFALTVTATPPTGQAVTVDANGVFDGQSADVTTDLSSALAAAGAPSGTSGQIEIRYLQENGDPVIYANAPALSALIPGGATWVRLDLETLGKSLGVDLNQLLGQGAQNPSDALSLLQSIGSVDKVGTETIDGVSTTHYTAEIDPTKVAEQAATQIGGALGQRIQNAVSNASATPAPIPVDVWIGDDGLVRRVVLDLSGTHDGRTGSLHLQLDISDYGTPVNVTAPPSSRCLRRHELGLEPGGERIPDAFDDSLASGEPLEPGSQLPLVRPPRPRPIATLRWHEPAGDRLCLPCGELAAPGLLRRKRREQGPDHHLRRARRRRGAGLAGSARRLLRARTPRPPALVCGGA